MATNETNGAPRGAAGPAVNRRVAQIRGGLGRVVTGREEVIKGRARAAAERIDLRTGGRHRNKLRLALRAVEFLVDRVSADPAAPRSGAERTGGRPDPREPEDLGEFVNLSDRG